MQTLHHRVHWRLLLRKVTTALFIFTAVLFAGALDRQPNHDYRARREALARRAGAGIVVIFAGVEAPGGLEPYHPDENYFYLTGLTDPGGAVVVASQEGGRPYTEILFLPERNRAEERWTGPQLGPDTAGIAQITGFDRVLPLDQLPRELMRLSPQPSAQALSVAGASTRPVLYVNQGADIEAPMKWLRRTNALVSVTSIDAGPLLTGLRMVKDSGEFIRIQKATAASVAAHIAAMKAMHPGVTERAIAGLMQYEFMKLGCEGPAYPPIVGAGLNSTILHYSANAGTVQAGDVVVIDVAGQYSGYASDITRTLPATGHFTARQREIYDIVLGAQQAAMDAFKAGKSTLGGQGKSSLYQVAYDYINSHGKDLHGSSLGQYFIHGLGHHVGLDVHDPAEPGRPLDLGMVFTIEPGIYIPEEKIGVRIEDIFEVGADGKLVRLSEGLPRTAEDVERTMASH
jgi:Xaa-Pro aminopeptidase